MTRLRAALGRIQQFGSHVSAYRAVAWLAVIVAGGAAFVLRYALSLSAPLLIGIALSVVALGALVATSAVRRRSGPVYRWVSAEYVYRFDAEDLRRQQQTIKVKIRANRDNVCCFQNSYYWSGAGDSEMRVLSNGHRFVGEAQADDGGRKRYWVHFDAPLRRGEEVEIHLEQDLFDERHQLRPMLTKAVLEPLDTLALKVIFPREVAPATTAMTARQCAYQGKPGEWRQVQRDTPQLHSDDRTTEFSYSPQPLRTGHRYELDWKPWKLYPNTGKKV